MKLIYQIKLTLKPYGLFEAKLFTYINKKVRIVCNYLKTRCRLKYFSLILADVFVPRPFY